MAEVTQSLSLNLDSVEELSQVLAGTSIEFHMHQLEAGRAPVAIEAAGTSSTFLMRTTLTGRTHQTGGLPARSYTFGLPLGMQSLVRFGIAPVNRDVLTLFDSDAGLDAVSEPGFDAITASFDASDFEALLASLGLDGDAFIAGRGSRHVSLPAERAAFLRLRLREALHAARRAGLANAALPVGLHTELAMDFATTFFSVRPQVSCSRKTRARVLRTALDYIQGHLDQRITVELLCRESAASISTLERAFRENIGISPKRYLTAVRLSCVRRALLQSDSRESVGDIASRLGFWHLSKMAADYRRMFGELPSQTRRAA